MGTGRKTARAVGLARTLGLVLVGMLVMPTLSLAADERSASPSPFTRTDASAAGGAEELWSCDGDPPGFPLEALDGPGGAEKAEGPEFDALRDGLEGLKEEWDLSPPDDREDRIPWTLVYQDEDEALFLARRKSKKPRYSSMHVEREDGTWEWAGFVDPCVLRPLITHGYGSSEWKVRRKAPPRSEDTVFDVRVNERACAGGQPATGRVMTPVIVYAEDSITITIPIQGLREALLEERLAGLESIEPGASPPLIPISVTCQGNPWTPFEVELSEPVGDRVLIDGGPWPPEQRWPIPKKG